MPKLRFTFQVEGKAQFDRAFSRLDLNISDLRPVFQEIKDEFFAIEREQFASQGKAGAGGQWAPLSIKYETIKNEKYPAQTILRASDKMFESLTGETSDTFFEANKEEMAIGTTRPYAKHHQKGGKNLPQREVISFSERQKNRLQKRIHAKLVSEIRKTGFKIEE